MAAFVEAIGGSLQGSAAVQMGGDCPAEAMMRLPARLDANLSFPRDSGEVPLSGLPLLSRRW